MTIANDKKTNVLREVISLTEVTVVYHLFAITATSFGWFYTQYNIFVEIGSVITNLVQWLKWFFFISFTVSSYRYILSLIFNHNIKSSINFFSNLTLNIDNSTMAKTVMVMVFISWYILFLFFTLWVGCRNTYSTETIVHVYHFKKPTVSKI